MSATLSSPGGEMAPPAPVFSYAQAAKGQPSTMATASNSSKGTSDSAEDMSKDSSIPQPQDLVEVPRPDDVHSTTAIPENTHNKKESGSENENPTATDSEAPSSKLETTSSSRGTTSAPSSPSIGNNPTMMTKKDDDVLIATNELESTWDKVSQVSHGEDKSSNKTEADGDDSKLSTSWEHVPPASQLRDAPPPSFNIWEKRALDAKAKSKDSKRAPPSASPQKTEPEITINSKRAELPSDTGKVDRRKVRAGSQTMDEKTGASALKDGVKAGDVKSRGTDDDKSYRGVRNGEVMKPVASMAPPPPPGDATSWPTPDLAKEDEKKKVQDRSERAEKEKTPNKPHNKEKWVHVPYVPTPVFNTPLPTTGRRGGRGGSRGGREGGGRGTHSTNGSIAVGDRVAGGNTLVSTSGAPTERGKGDMGPPRQGSLPSRQKRASSAGPSSSREQRKPGDSYQEKREDGSQRPVPTATRFPSNEARRTSISTQTDQSQGNQLSPSSSRKQFSHGGERDSGFSGNGQDQPHFRSGPDRRNETGMRAQEFPREANGYHPRERGEPRPDRGRGGYRGNRGSHNGFGNAMNGGPNSQASQGYGPTKSQSYTEQRHSSQPGASSYAAGRDSRHSRANSRSQSIPQPSGFGRFASGGPAGGPQHLPAIQTEVANMYGYQPNHQGVMSAIPYNPYMEHMQLQGMVMMQMEYYFSLDNLCKDMFLRKQMDSKGWVFLSVLQKFNRIKQLTSDLDLLRFVCSRSNIIEFRVGPDNVDRVRRSQDWQQWVLAIEERDPAAQHDGPPDMQQPQIFPYVPQDYHRGSVASNSISPRASFSGMQYAVQPISFNGQGSASQVNDSQITQTPLSAAVPDFTPSLQPLNNQSLQNLEMQTELENTFSDQQVESLKIVIRKPVNPTALVRPLFPTGSRSFSNGSLDPRNILREVADLSHEEQQSATHTNGETTQSGTFPDDAQRSTNPSTSVNVPRLPDNVASPVFWVKGGDQEAPIEDLPNELTHESYTKFRHNALNQREQVTAGQCHHDMDILYQFWSHFLIRNFNARMYEEFRRMALDDASNRNSSVGLRNLITFYDESVLGQKPISDTLAKDYVDLVQTETGKEQRPAFDKLRAAWRNGALNLKNRVKVDKIIDTNLKAELER